jgi:broad specificity phosphatase PhoE
MPPRKLILIKHAESLLTPEVTAERWQLTDRGRAQCVPLAERLRTYAPSNIIASTEPKAIETGQIISRQLKVPFETELGLHEHDRSNVPLVPREMFEEEMRRFFSTPHELVYGLESAEEARNRFAAAVTRVLREYPEGTIAIVTHGTVIALLLAAANGRDVFQLWKELGTPSFAVVDPGNWRIETLVADIAR